MTAQISSPSRPRSDNTRGAVWILISVVGASVMMLGVRLLTTEMHSVMLVFLRSVFGVPLVIPILVAAARRAEPLRFTDRRAHLARGVLVAMAINAGFYSIWQLPLATATILFFMAPIFATAVAVVLTGERVGARRWGAIAAGMLGAVIILRPGFGDFDPVMLLALASAAAFAVALMLGKRAAQADGPNSVFVSSALIVAVATLPLAMTRWTVPDQPWQWAALALVVAASSLRNYADIRAYAIGDAGFLAPFSYLRLVTIGGIGYFIFGEVIDGPTLAGGAIIIAATLYIALREARVKPDPGPPKLP